MNTASLCAHDARRDAARIGRVIVWSAVAAAGLFVLLVLFAGKASAVPAAPRNHTLHQPNGKALTVRLVGDEWYSEWEHRGYTIRKDQRGVWRYAELDATRDHLKPSNRVA